MKKYFLFIIINLLINTLSFAGDPPVLEGKTKAAKTNETLPQSTLKIVEVTRLIGLKADEETEVTTIQSDKKGNFVFTGKYNKYYRIYCTSQKYLPMFFDFDTRLPNNKQEPETERGVRVDVNFFQESDKEMMKLEMLEKYPFDVFKLNPKNVEFFSDEKIRSEVQKGLFRDKVWEKEEEKRKEESKKKLEAEKKQEELDRLKNTPFSITVRACLKETGTIPLPTAKVLLFESDPIYNPNTQALTSYTANLFGKLTITNLKKEKVYFAALEGVSETNFKDFKLKGKQNQFLVTSEPRLMKLNNLNYSVTSFKTDLLFEQNFETTITGISISGNLLIDDADHKPIANAKVSLKDVANKIIQSTRTNALGGFAFTNINPDEKYLIAVDEADPTLVANKKVVIVNKSGQSIYTANANANGQFAFEILPTDQIKLQMLEVDNVDLNISLKGRIVVDQATKVPLKNSKLFLFDANGKPISTTSTDIGGFFVFKNVVTDGSYLMSLDENDPALKTISKVYLENTDGIIVREINKDQVNKFTFKILPTDFVQLQQIEVNDPWLNITKKNNVGTTIAEQVYFKAGDDKITPEATIILNKIADI
ncbi:MAG: carboxypeptidase regulatory-like domain-containing protein, partial [Bacteroidia bacterium]|nr:carboxypeptidase regulatory-like domain-containing protein [Bacteroidia bacterium]